VAGQHTIGGNGGNPAAAEEGASVIGDHRREDATDSPHPAPIVARIEVPRSLAIISTNDGQTQRRRLKHDGTPECVALLPAEAISRLGDLGQMDFRGCGTGVCP